MIWRTDAKLQTSAPLIGLRLILPLIYNEAFTGRARAIPRCRFCLAVMKAKIAPLLQKNDPLPPIWLHSLPSVAARGLTQWRCASCSISQVVANAGTSIAALHIYAPSAGGDLTQHRSVTCPIRCLGPALGHLLPARNLRCRGGVQADKLVKLVVFQAASVDQTE